MPTPKAQAGQENFRLILQTGIDFSINPPTVQTIQYKNCNAVEREWSAKILEGSEATGQIYHDFEAGAGVPATGTYTVRAKLVINGKIVYTTPVAWKTGDFC